MKTDLAQVWNAEDRRHGADTIKGLEPAYGAKSSKAIAKITDDVECPQETTAEVRKGEVARHLLQTMRTIRRLTSGHFGS